MSGHSEVDSSAPFFDGDIVNAEAIGEGAFGIVYRAYQTSLQRDIAVKVLKAGAAGRSDGIDRFRRECLALGSLSGHPNIVTMHKAAFPSAGAADLTTDAAGGGGGEPAGDDDPGWKGAQTDRLGLPYLVMELVSGGSLAGRPMKWQEATAVVVKLAGAVATAHANGVIHRDIKPANILMAGDEPKLADFGVAAIDGDTFAELRSNAAAGTLAYASPEMVAGSPVGEATDVWAMGATLATLIGGRPPFAHADDESPWPMVLRIMDEPPTDLRPRVPDDLWQVIDASLAKHADERPQSAAALGRELQAVQAHHGLPVTTMTAPALLDSQGCDDGEEMACAVAGDEDVEDRPGPIGLIPLPVRLTSTHPLGHTAFGVPSPPQLPSGFGTPQPPGPPAGMSGFSQPQAPQAPTTPFSVPHAPSAPALHPTVTVSRGDSLWSLAQRHLGDGNRYREIWELNKGHLMAGGGSFDSPNLIQPGWQLELPPDASGAGLSSSPAAQAARPPGPLATRIAALGHLVGTHMAVAAAVAAVTIAGSTLAAVGLPKGTPHKPVPAQPVAFVPTRPGPALFSVPGGLVGSPQAVAVQRLQTAGFSDVVVTSQPDSTAPAGTVVALQPASGTRWPATSRVVVVVSSAAPGVAVPDVVGQPATSATDLLRHDGFAFTVSSQLSANVPAGTVISQTPPAGTLQPSGSSETLVVSSGPAQTPLRPIPNVVGRTAAAAESAIEKAGFTYTVTVAASPTVLTGEVISQLPGAGTPEPAAATVSIVVSSGARPCPSVTRQPAGTAAQTVNGAGCSTTTTTQYSTTVPAGQVISETPPAPQAKGTAVTLVISLGPPPPPPPCPSVVGQSQATASAALNSAGCSTTTTTQYSTTVPAGQVISETPPAPQAKGTAVTLVISLGPPPPPPPCPSVVGQSQATASAALNSAGCPVTVTTQISGAVPAGQVISQSPPAPEPKGTPVTVIVAVAPPCPNVVGQPQATAVAALQTAGCPVTVTLEQMVESPSGYGNVTSQSPAPPEPRGTRVTLVVPIPPPTCPNVVGQTESAAQTALQGAGCAVAVRWENSLTVPYEVVMDQSPASAPIGSTVTIGLSRGFGS